MNSERYFDTRTFLEHQIRTLVAPADLPQSDFDEILELFGSVKTTDSALARVIERVNNTKKQYLQRFFTQQATRHVALQILESESSAQARALDQTTSVLDLVQSDDDIDDDSESDQDIEKQLRERLRLQFELMSDSKLLSLSQDLFDGEGSGKELTGGLSGKLQKARDDYELAQQQLAVYKRVQEAVAGTITKDPQEAVQPHLLHPRPDLLNLIGRVRSLSARLNAKAATNPEMAKNLLNALQSMEEDDDGIYNPVQPDMKRQKLIINNDPSDILEEVFDASAK